MKIDFAEVYNKGPNQRVMKITSGDTVLADNLDLFAVVGFAKAYELLGKVTHEEDALHGPLVITFTGVHGNAKFNAIQILDDQGNVVACMKAAELASASDAAALKIPIVTDPVIYTDPDKPMDARIDDLIKRMSLSEKGVAAGQCGGGDPPPQRARLQLLERVPPRRRPATAMPRFSRRPSAWPRPGIRTSSTRSGR